MNKTLYKNIVKWYADGFNACYENMIVVFDKRFEIYKPLYFHRRDNIYQRIQETHNNDNFEFIVVCKIDGDILSYIEREKLLNKITK